MRSYVKINKQLFKYVNSIRRNEHMLKLYWVSPKLVQYVRHPKLRVTLQICHRWHCTTAKSLKIIMGCCQKISWWICRLGSLFFLRALVLRSRFACRCAFALRYDNEVTLVPMYLAPLRTDYWQFQQFLQIRKVINILLTHRQQQISTI